MSMNYGTLKTAVAGYLHRSDLTTQIPDFIDQARLRLGADLRSTGNYVAGTVTSFVNGLTALPANMGELASATMDDVALVWMSPGAIAEAPDSGSYSVIGGDLYVPEAASTTVVDLTYYAIPAALVNNADVSEGMVEFPQLWICASVAEGALYCRDLELASAMNEAYGINLASANQAGSMTRFGPAPATIASQRMFMAEAGAKL